MGGGLGTLKAFLWGSETAFESPMAFDVYNSRRRARMRVYKFILIQNWLKRNQNSTENRVTRARNLHSKSFNRTHAILGHDQCYQCDIHKKKRANGLNVDNVSGYVIGETLTSKT